MSARSERLQVTNERTGAVLGTDVRTARTPVARLRGLLGQPRLEAGEGLLIEPCNGVHMLFMGYALDVVFLDRQWRVVEVRHELRPWRIAPYVRGAYAALELPAGTLERTGTEAGDVLCLDAARAVDEAAA